MDTCQVYFLVMGLVLLGDTVALLLAPKIAKAQSPDPLTSGGEVKATPDRVMMIRLVIGSSMVFVLAIFAYLLNQEGCMG